MNEKLKIAVFIDYDNIEIGVKSTMGREFDISAILEGLKERGEVVAKIAYADWGRQASATRALTEYGVQMVQRNPGPRGDKNGADINLALDALEMAFTRDHINTFAIVSGDSDFMSLVEKLKQYDKRVLIVGGKAFTSTILQRNCHEFISYESLMDNVHPTTERGRPRQKALPPRPAEALPFEHALPLIDRALSALELRQTEAQLGPLKRIMVQLDPAFAERDYGARAFSGFVHKLADAGLVRLHRRDGSYVVERVGGREEIPPAPMLTSEDAIPLLRAVIEANLTFVSAGMPAKELAALFHATYPDFNHKDYGFTEFEELLNLGQDKRIVQIEADPERGLRLFPGLEFQPTAGGHVPQGTAAPTPVSADPASSPEFPVFAGSPEAIGRRRRPERKGPGRSARWASGKQKQRDAGIGLGEAKPKTRRLSRLPG